MKRATCIIIAALICAGALFAWIGDVSLTNVGFNGTIENVGESAAGNHSDVTIFVTKEAAQNSVYTIGKVGSGGECWINNLSISGNKAFTVNLVNCTIYGEVRITGGTVTFSGCTFEGTDGEIPAFDCTGMTGGSVTVTGGSVSHPTQFTMDFHGSGVTAVQIDGSAFGTSSSSPLNAVDLHGCTQLNSFTFGNSIYVSTLNLSGCSNVNVSEAGGIAGQWDDWKVTGITDNPKTAASGNRRGLLLRGMGLTDTVAISNSNLYSIDISDNSITDLTLDTGGNSNARARAVFADGNGIESASITMENGSGNYLDLSGNSLGNYRPDTIGTGNSKWVVIDTSTVYWDEGESQPSTRPRSSISNPTREDPTTATELGGTTYTDLPNYVTCSVCGGDGKIECPRSHSRKSNGKWQVTETCSICDGNYENFTLCTHCDDGVINGHWTETDRVYGGVVSGSTYHSDTLPSTGSYLGQTVTITEYESKGGGAYDRYSVTYRWEGTECQYCDGDGWINCTNCNDGFVYVNCPTCSGSGTVPCTNHCEDHGTTGDPHYVVQDGTYRRYSATKTTYVYTAWNKAQCLTINGHGITTWYNLGYRMTIPFDTADFGGNFTAEWSQLDQVAVDLTDNNICYAAGYKTAAGGSMNGTIRVRTGYGIGSDDYIVKYDPCYNSGTKPAFRVTVSSTIEKNPVVTNIYKVSDISAEPDRTAEKTAVFTIQNVGQRSGPEMYVYPFGEEASGTLE